MGEAIEILKLIQGLPVAVSIALSAAAVSIVGYAILKKFDITDKTSSSSIHDQQIESLMKQVKLLSEELTLARQQLAEIHNQNIKLMEQLRSANQRIGELELTLQQSKHSE